MAAPPRAEPEQDQAAIPQQARQAERLGPGALECEEPDQGPESKLQPGQKLAVRLRAADQPVPRQSNWTE